MPVPPGSWSWRQRWSDLLFAHWPVAADLLRPQIPERLELDTFDGTAWVGVVPFRMERVRPRWLPAVPWLSSFAELNLRTYVTRDGSPGVFFFSLDAANPVAVSLGRRWFYLPYFRARTTCSPEGDGIAYRSRRTHDGAPPARFEGRYGPAGDVFHAAPGTLEHFLTERYCLYSSGISVGRPRRGVGEEPVYRMEIHHAPWPLQPATVTVTVNTLLASAGLEAPAEQPPHVLFARKLDVRAWPLREV